jgi:hypothetical protein
MIKATYVAVALSTTEFPFGRSWSIRSPLRGTNTYDDWSSSQTGNYLSVTHSGRTIPEVENFTSSEVLVGNDR